jgi:hypothetical protein
VHHKIFLPSTQRIYHQSRPSEISGVPPGETKQLTMFLDRRAFSYYDVAKHG